MLPHWRLDRKHQTYVIPKYAVPRAFGRGGGHMHTPSCRCASNGWPLRQHLQPLKRWQVADNLWEHPHVVAGKPPAGQDRAAGRDEHLWMSIRLADSGSGCGSSTDQKAWRHTMQRPTHQVSDAKHAMHIQVTSAAAGQLLMLIMLMLRLLQLLPRKQWGSHNCLRLVRRLMPAGSVCSRLEPSHLGSNPTEQWVQDKHGS